tara:strand:+ start:183 stop:680 length:498 start_codon:yes stop_codon:yes gene_type:complete
MKQGLLDAPIPGMSLTHELGARPWQTPPKAATVGQAMETYLPAFEDDDVVEEVITVLKSGIPVTSIAEAAMLGGVMEGRHTIDVGILILPFLMEIISYIGDLAKIEYTMGNKKVVSDNVKIQPPSDSEIAVAAKRVTEIKEEIASDTVEETIETEEPKGLMARRQ